MVLAAHGFGNQPRGAQLDLADFFEDFARDHRGENSVLNRGSNWSLPTTKFSSKLPGMSATDILAKARELRPEERREIAEALLDDLESEESPEFIAELERRAQDALKNPDDCIPWEQVRADAKKKYNWP
jgi:putative addiction module component (TIGR02574 family)